MRGCRTARLRRILAGNDGPGRRALPVGELLHPLSLAAALLLVVNDWVLKGAGLVPAWLTGKLSDVAGLAVAPLLCTALCDLALAGAARLGAPVDWSLGPRRLGAAIAAVGGIFAAVKLSSGAAAAVAEVWAEIAPGAAIVCDPSDLLALPALAVALWVGRRELAQVPLGRCAVLVAARRRDGRALAPGLADVTRAGGDPAAVAALAAALERFADGDAEARGDAEAALETLRR